MKHMKPKAQKEMPKHMPMPARNLGTHLKAPKSGEIVTQHRWVDRKAPK